LFLSMMREESSAHAVKELQELKDRYAHMELVLYRTRGHLRAKTTEISALIEAHISVESHFIA
jgi:hypothetical protein